MLPVGETVCLPPDVVVASQFPCIMPPHCCRFRHLLLLRARSKFGMTTFSKPSLPTFLQESQAARKFSSHSSQLTSPPGIIFLECHPPFFSPPPHPNLRFFTRLDSKLRNLLSSFLPQDILMLYLYPKTSSLPLSCLEIARRHKVFRSADDIHGCGGGVTVSVMAAVSLGEGRREGKKKMFLPVKIYRITTKVELAPFLLLCQRETGEKAGRKMKLLLPAPLSKLEPGRILLAVKRLALLRDKQQIATRIVAKI